MSVYLLDTDTVSLLFRSSSDETPLYRRFLQTVATDRAISTVTIEEMMRGALAVIRAEEMKAKGTQGYQRLAQLVPFLATFRIAPFTDATQEIYRAMPASLRRLGSGDCKIAATALHYNLIVVTRNLRHFQQIPGVVCEDWTEELEP
ncbi:type II toxin-antitoxin system VapC family toxin [Armatimonas sp.]|uniref:type II toxin-antitoxin system VapC family toxin n=1 Tax=Armatimonas sp. TaxID=1872638 RepID=UPI00286BF00F|nr:type II toxin-antitoxin system VapC family toxin [Armatimonas sp.]